MATKQEIIDRLSQCGGLSYQDWIRLLDSIYFDGDLGDVFIPVTSNVLPENENSYTVFSIITEGTYTQQLGAPIVVPEGYISIISNSGDTWVKNGTARVKGDTPDLTQLYEDFNEVETKANQAYTVSNSVNSAAINANTTANTANNKANQAINEVDELRDQINDLVLESGDSTPEVVQARGGEDVLNDRLDRMDSSISQNYSFEKIQSTIVATRKTGRHLAFGSILRVKSLVSSVGIPNLNLVVWRNGANHQDDGRIEGIFVTDDGNRLSEPFIIASPSMYPNIGWEGGATPNDFRDPNLSLLPNGQILLTFFYANWVGSTRDHVGSYAMLGTFDESNRTISWGTPVIQFHKEGVYFFGRPIVDGEYMYCATYTHPGIFDATGNIYVYIARAPIANPLSWEIIGSPVIGETAYEPVLRKTQTGKYVILYRRQSGGELEVKKVISNSIDNGWSSPKTVFVGSSALKGFIINNDNSYFIGIRYKNSEPNGVALLYGKNIEDDDQLTVSSIVHSARIPSDEAGYFEIESLGNKSFLGMYHTEGGQFIKTVRFNEFDVKNRSIPEDLAVYSPNRKVSELAPFVFIGNEGNRSYNLVNNPLFYIPYGFLGVPYWSGLISSKSLNTDDVGEGYAKYSTSGSTVRQVLSKQVSKIFTQQTPIGACRIYCTHPNRITFRSSFGNVLGSRKHSGKGWETMIIKLEDAIGGALAHTGTKDNNIIIEINVTTGTLITFFVDWVSFSFGNTIPDIYNGSAQRLGNLARLNLTAKTNTYNLEDIGMGQKTPNSYFVQLIESNQIIDNYSVTKTATSFTITLADDTPWGSSLYGVFEIIG